MAKKSLANQVLKKKNLLKTVADISGEFQEEVLKEDIGETNVNDLPEELQKNIIYLSDEMLLDDPYNKTFYGDLEVEELSHAMKNSGFQGVILAYRCNDGSGKYMIESGHRRRMAGRKAGLKQYPVLPTKAPEFDWERKLRLFGANLHGRKEGSPMRKAVIAQGIFEARKEEVDYKKKEGLLEEGEITALNQLVSMDMEISAKMVERYRRLLNLIPELQEMVDSEQYAWSSIAEASNLSLEKQKNLTKAISEKSEKGGIESVKAAWIDTVVKKLKGDKNNTTIEILEEPRSVRSRRKNGTKIVLKNAVQLHEVLDNDAIFKKKEIPMVIETLEELKKSIDGKLEELKDKI